MADEKGDTPNERKRRPAPTIDLSATEVASAETPSQTGNEKKEEPRTSAPPSRGNRLAIVALLGGVVAGAAAVLTVLWVNGTLQPNNKIGENSAVADFAVRLGKLEQTAAKPATNPTDPAPAERLAAVETEMKALGVTLTALNRRSEDTAASVSAARERADAAVKAVEALQAKLAAIERSAKVTQEKVAQNSGSDAVARRSLAAVALHDAVMRGAPYAGELAVAKHLGADASAVAALEPFAASGIPAEAVLGRDLAALLPSLIDATGADAAKAGGFLDRLQANAEKLVRVHPVDAPPGDDASAVLARIEVKAARSDLAGIDAEFDKLPAKARTLADGWRKKLAARNAAIAASRKLLADSAAALGSP